MATKKLQILGKFPTGSSNIYVQAEEPVDAPDGALWVDLDEASVEEALYETYVEEVDDLLGGES